MRTLLSRVKRRVSRGADRQGADPWPTLSASHLSVLDGHTLNVAVTMPVSMEPLRAVLEFVRQREVVGVPMVVVETPGQRSRLELTAVIGRQHFATEKHPLETLELPAGRWNLLLRIVDRRGCQQVRSLSVPATTKDDGLTIVGPPSAVFDQKVKILATPSGTAALDIKSLPLSAEVDRVDYRWDRIDVRGHFVGAASIAKPMEVRFVRRSDGETVSLPLLADADRFEFSAPLDAIAPLAEAEEVWEVRLHDQTEMVRIGRRLTDIKSPKSTFRIPARLVVTPKGNVVRAHAYYTEFGNLCLSCLCLESSSR